MKFNWGTGIFLFYTIFAITMFYQAYKTTHYKHNLVVDNYYEKDLAYQSQYDKIVNSQALKNPLQINYSNKRKTVELAFPDEVGTIEGTVLFYRPSDKKMDIQLPITIDNQNVMLINSDKFPKGYWKIEVDWKGGEKEFFNNKAIRIN